MAKDIDGVIVIPTPAGTFRVVPSANSKYPGVSVYLNGELVSTTEYNSDTEAVRTIAYNSEDDEPAIFSDFNKGAMK